MSRYTYHKGHRNLSDGSSYRCIFRIDNEFVANNTLFNETAIEVYTLEKSAITHIEDETELNTKGYYVAREISESEFYAYRIIGQLLDELYMNQFTGGFPRKSTVDKVLLYALPRTVGNTIREMEERYE